MTPIAAKKPPASTISPPFLLMTPFIAADSERCCMPRGVVAIAAILRLVRFLIAVLIGAGVIGSRYWNELFSITKRTWGT